MIFLGIVCLIIAYVLAIPILWTLGAILLFVGLILLALSFSGHMVGGRRYWY